MAPVSRAGLGARGAWQVPPSAIPSLQSCSCAPYLFSLSGVWESPVWGDKFHAEGTFWSAQNVFVAHFEQEGLLWGWRREGRGWGGDQDPPCGAAGEAARAPLGPLMARRR